MTQSFVAFHNCLIVIRPSVKTALEFQAVILLDWSGVDLASDPLQSKLL